MSFVKAYVMSAKPDGAEALEASLVAFRSALRDLPGSIGVSLMRDLDRPEIFHFIEEWEGRDAHAAAGKMLPREIMDALKQNLGAAPVSHNLEDIA